ncbi:MAG TPA: FTR1 family protein [Solirubrobacteraceae bacterium]|nr:FTR1 family protein [Solirubrobacteraceae bacterium]
MAQTASITRTPKSRGQTLSMYFWTALVLAVAVVAVIFGWHAQGGPVNPTTAANPHRLGSTTVVVDSAILVFREGLECILVLAAITASLRGANTLYRRPIAAGGAVGLAAGVATWFVIVWFIGLFNGAGALTLQAATGIPAIIVLLIVMNWFFHKVYWTGWISSHNKRRKSLFSGGDVEANRRRMLFGLGLLGFSSVYRESFEIVIFLQGLREVYGSSIVLEGVVLGLLFTGAVGVLTFVMHARLPYKKLLIITGVLLLLVLLVQVGEEVNEMQLAGWIGWGHISWLGLPGWMGTWFSLFNNWPTFLGQFLAFAVVIGSYVGAQYLRVWRPRRRGEPAARIAEADPEQPADETTTRLPSGRPLTA